MARREFESKPADFDCRAWAAAAIHEQLDLVRQQWVFFDNALARVGDECRRARRGVVSSENILKVMDQVTGMYSRLS